MNMHSMFTNVIEIKFEYPWLLLFLILIPFVIGITHFLQGKIKVPLPTLQFKNVRNYKSFLYFLFLIIDSLILIILILTLSGPRKISGFTYIEEEGIDIALVLDISASMMAGDFQPSRLEVLKKLTQDFIKRNTNHRIALFLFAKEVFVQSSLTKEYDSLLQLISVISYYMIDHSISGGTHIGDALLVATKELEKSKIKGRDQAIILITDGESEGGLDPLVAARYIKEKSIRLFVIGIGGLKEVPVFIDGKPFISVHGGQLYTKLDDEQLKEITKIANGKYYRAIDGNSLALIFNEITKLNQKPLKTKKVILYRYYTFYLALFVLFLYLLRIWFFYIYIRRPSV